jgi:hypothetical protein
MTWALVTLDYTLEYTIYPTHGNMQFTTHF